MIRGFLLWSGNSVGIRGWGMWILWTEMVKIGGWGVGGCTTPKNARNIGFFGWKYPGSTMLKNPPFSTSGGYWGNREIIIISRDIFPIWIHSEKFPVKTLTHIFSQQYYRFTITPIYYLIYAYIISDIQSLFRVHIAISVHYTRTL